MGHQEIILENIKSYLSQCYDESYTKKNLPIPDEFKAILNSIKPGSYIEGHCFGFSVIHGSMDEINQLLWWEFVLECLETWNPDPNLPNILNKKIVETDFVLFIPRGISEEEKKKLEETTVDSLFKRAANYIIYHHAKASNTPFLPKNLNQSTLLQLNNKENPFFDISDSKGTILSVKDKQTFVGNYTDIEVAEILRDDEQPMMYLVLSEGHVIRIGVHGSRWFIYDPNYIKNKDKQAEYKYLRYFPNKLAAINEIFSLIGNDIVIEKISTKQKIASASFLNNDEAMLHFIKHNVSSKTINLLADFPEKFTQLMSYIVSKNDSIEIQQLRKKFTIALTMKHMTQGFTGLQAIAKNSPAAISQLIDYMEKDTSTTIDGITLKLNFAFALSTSDNNGMTGLHTIALHAPVAISQLIDYMKKERSLLSEEIKKHFALALSKSKDGWTVLYMMALYAPASINQLIDYMEMEKDASFGDNEIKLHFARALSEKDDDGCTALHVMALYAPASINQLIDYMEKDTSFGGNEIKLHFARALSEKDDDGCTALHMMTLYAPAAISNLIGYMEKDTSFGGNQIKCHFARALSEKDDDGRTALHMMALYTPAAISQLIDYMDKNSSPDNLEMKIWFCLALGQELLEIPRREVTTVNLIASSDLIKLIKLLNENAPYLLEIDCGLKNGLTLKQYAILANSQQCSPANESPLQSKLGMFATQEFKQPMTTQITTTVRIPMNDPQYPDDININNKTANPFF